jgi:hypothetical protein
MKDFEDLTHQLAEKLEIDRKRLHYEKQVMIQDLWEQEKKYLLQLPETDYPIFKEELVKVNKYNEIKINNTLVHIPKASNYGQLNLLLTWDRLKVVSPDGEILLDDYRPYMNKRTALPWMSILKTWIYKPRVLNYSRYRDYLPGRIKEYLLVDNLVMRRDRLKAIVNLLVTHDMKRINEEFYDLISQEKLGQQQNPYEVDWNEYDSLSPKGEVKS